MDDLIRGLFMFSLSRVYLPSTAPSPRLPGEQLQTPSLLGFRIRVTALANTEHITTRATHSLKLSFNIIIESSLLKEKSYFVHNSLLVPPWNIVSTFHFLWESPKKAQKMPKETVVKIERDIMKQYEYNS